MPNDPTTSRTAAPPLIAQDLGASLTVADVRRSLAWYRDVLGFALDREHERDGRVFRLRDPDGFRLVFSSPRST